MYLKCEESKLKLKVVPFFLVMCWKKQVTLWWWDCSYVTISSAGVHGPRSTRSRGNHHPPLCSCGSQTTFPFPRCQGWHGPFRDTHHQVSIILYLSLCNSISYYETTTFSVLFGSYCLFVVAGTGTELTSNCPHNC